MERSNDILQYTENEKGLAQGGILFGLLANMTLDGLERFISERNRRKHSKLTSSFVRYANEIIYFATTYEQALKAKDIIEEFLKKTGLNIHEAKTRITNIHEHSFEFLGYKFKRIYRNNKKRKSARVCIPLSARRHFQSKIRKLK